jgi:hypothetical protein
MKLASKWLFEFGVVQALHATFAHLCLRASVITKQEM